MILSSRKSWNEYMNKNYVEIYDVKSDTMQNVDIVLPFNERAEIHVYITDNVGQNEIIIHGYLRNCGKSTHLNAFPVELIGVIAEFFYIQYLHLFKRWSGDHWKIPLFDSSDFPK